MLYDTTIDIVVIIYYYYIYGHNLSEINKHKNTSTTLPNKQTTDIKTSTMIKPVALLY